MLTFRVLSVSVTSWARLALVAKLSNTSRASLFLLFFGKEQTNMAAFRGAQIRSKTVKKTKQKKHCQRNQMRQQQLTNTLDTSVSRVCSFLFLLLLLFLVLVFVCVCVCVFFFVVALFYLVLYAHMPPAPPPPPSLPSTPLPCKPHRDIILHFMSVLTPQKKEEWIKHVRQ